MKTAVILAIVGGLVMIGIASMAALDNRINRVEDKVENRMERVENKIDHQTEDIKDLSVAIGRIEEKLDE